MLHHRCWRCWRCWPLSGRPRIGNLNPLFASFFLPRTLWAHQRVVKHESLVKTPLSIKAAATMGAVFGIDVEDALEQARPVHARRRAVPMFVCGLACLLRWTRHDRGSRALARAVNRGAGFQQKLKNQRPRAAGAGEGLRVIMRLLTCYDDRPDPVTLPRAVAVAVAVAHMEDESSGGQIGNLNATFDCRQRYRQSANRSIARCFLKTPLSSGFFVPASTRGG